MSHSFHFSKPVQFNHPHGQQLGKTKNDDKIFCIKTFAQLEAF